MGSRDRKPRNFPPPQATTMLCRGGGASLGRPGHVHCGYTPWVLRDLRAQPVRAKEDQSLLQDCISQYTSCCNKWALKFQWHHRKFIFLTGHNPGAGHTLT